MEEYIVSLKGILADREARHSLPIPPAYWKHCMLHDFVSKTAQWVKKHQLQLEDGQISNLPRKASWKWGPLRKSAPFKGMFQRRHLTLIIRALNDDFSIPVASNFKAKPPASVRDVPSEQISFAKFEEQLKAAEHSDYDPKTHVIYYIHGGLEEPTAMPVTDNRTLRDAICYLQAINNDTVTLQMDLKVNQKVRVALK